MLAKDQPFLTRDLRASAIYREVSEFCDSALAPGFGTATNLLDIAVAPDGRELAVTASILSGLVGSPEIAVFRCDEYGHGWEFLARGACVATSPVFSPDGSRLAVLADEHPFLLQPRVLSPKGDAETLRLKVPGNAEALAWYPERDSLLVLTAQPGAEQATSAGARRLSQAENLREPWEPEIEPDPSADALRQVFEVRLSDGASRALTPRALTVWEFAPLGSHHLAIVASADRHERGWYGAALYLLDLREGRASKIYSSARQLGNLASRGDTLLFCEALASDRGLLAGALKRFSLGAGRITPVEAEAIDVSSIRFRAATRVLISGLRGLETVVAEIDLSTGRFTPRFTAEKLTCGPLAPAAIPIGLGEDFLMAEEGAHSPPALVRDGPSGRRLLHATAHRGTDFLRAQHAGAEPIHWSSRDGTPLAGWLYRPLGPPPWPLISDVHGGPVWSARPQWHGRSRPDIPLWLREGFAVFFPNFRGSVGWGGAFAEKIVGDMGGEDAHDVLSGIDELVRRGLAKPDRLAIAGSSYGGFAACWLPCLDTRFCAALAVSPVTNWLAQHFTSNIAHFDALFLATKPAPEGRYIERSPVFNARNHRTPTLLLAGAQDRATPAEQALQFEQTLREQGVPCEAAIYPGEGHGIRSFPAIIDAAARSLAWLRQHAAPRVGATATGAAASGQGPPR